MRGSDGFPMVYFQRFWTIIKAKHRGFHAGVSLENIMVVTRRRLAFAWMRTNIISFLMDGESKLEDRESIIKDIKDFFFVKLYTKESGIASILIIRPLLALGRIVLLGWKELLRKRKLELLFFIWVVTGCRV